MKDLGRLFGAAESLDECLALVAAITNGGEQDWQIAALTGLAAGLQARDHGSETQSVLETLASIDTPQGRDARKRLASQMARAEGLAVDEAAPIDRRLPAIELLGYDEWSATGDTLRRLLEPRHPTVVQLAAVRALSRMRDPAAAASLVEPGRWRAYTPQVRDVVLSALLTEERHVLVLLDAISRGDVSATALGASRWRRLTSHRNPGIRERAGTLHSATDTARAIQAHERKREDVLARSGNAAWGAAVFAKHCAACHTFNAAGGRVGPDISGIRNQPADAILLHIAVPDYEITPGYEAYAVEMRNGTTIVGRLESEAPTSITLRDAGGQAHSILRADVQSMAAAPSSLMPAGLAQAMSPQELADLIAYLKSAGPSAPARTR
jgi:putative heme-binding domain-containing protein